MFTLTQNTASDQLTEEAFAEANLKAQELGSADSLIVFEKLGGGGVPVPVYTDQGIDFVNFVVIPGILATMLIASFIAMKKLMQD